MSDIGSLSVRNVKHMAGIDSENALRKHSNKHVSAQSSSDDEDEVTVIEGVAREANFIDTGQNEAPVQAEHVPFIKTEPEQGLCSSVLEMGMEDDDPDDLMDDTDPEHMESIQLRRRAFHAIILQMKFPFSYLPVLLFAILVTGIAVTYALFLSVFDVQWKGEGVESWLLMILIMTGVLVGADIFAGLVLFIVGYHFARTKLFYFASGLRNGTVSLIWGIAGLILQAIILSNLTNNFKSGMQKFFVSVIVVSVLYLLRVVLEKHVILKVSAGAHLRMIEAMNQQRILEHILRYAEEQRNGQQSENFFSFSLGKRKLSSLRNSLHPGQAENHQIFHSDEKEEKAFRGEKEGPEIQNDKEAVKRTAAETFFFAEASKKVYLRGPSLFVKKNFYSAKLSTAARVYLQEQRRIKEKKYTGEITSVVMHLLDTTQKGYLVQEDFVLVFPHKWKQQEAFLTFNPHFYKRILYDDLLFTIEEMIGSRGRIQNGMDDREDVAVILRHFGGVFFWSLMLILVLFIFDVDPIIVILPYLSVMLAFSFAFGGTIRSLCESAILVLVVTPYEVGDRVLIAGGGASTVIVDRITLFHTIVHKPEGQVRISA